jgi:hypothetical protein
MKQQHVPVRPDGGSDRSRHGRRSLRLLVLGATASVVVWTGHTVTWEMLGRAGALRLLERIGLVALVVTSVAGMRPRWWFAAGAVVLASALLL